MKFFDKEKEIMPRKTIASLEERIATQEQLLEHYRTQTHKLQYEKGEQHAIQSIKAQSISAATQLALANAKLTYAISRIIEVANKV